jgi:hypothetical protein
MLGLFAVNLLLRVFYLRYQFVNGDEAVRALTALGVLRGERLYLDVITDKPPGTTLFYAGVLSLFHHSMPAVHIAAALWNFATSIAIFALGARFYSGKTGLWAAFLFVYFAASYQTQDSMAANTELLMALPYVLSYYCYLRGSSRLSAVGSASPTSLQGTCCGNEWAWLVVAGLLAGIAALFKQVGLLLLGFFAVNEILKAIVDRRTSGLPIRKPAGASQEVRFSHEVPDSKTDGFDAFRYRPRNFVAAIHRSSLIAVGVSLIFVGLAAWLWETGAISGFWRNVMQLGGLYIGSLPASLWFKFLLFRPLGYVLLTASLWLLAGLGLGPAVKLVRLTVASTTAHHSTRDDEASGLAATDLAIALWAIVSLAGVFSSGRFYGHYFIPALPALSLLAARGAVKLLNEARRPQAALMAPRRPRALALAALVVLLFAFNFFRFHHRTAILAYETITGGRTRWSREWGMTRREQTAQEVADIIHSRGVEAGQPLYIWGYALDVYWRSGCIPASRYLTPYYVTGEFYPEVLASAAPAAGSFWQEARIQFIDDLKRNRPRLILNVDEPIETLPYPEIVDFVHQNYRLDGFIGPDPAYQFIVYSRKDDN